MSEREINIAIAEARGWTDTPIVDGKYGQADVPDYCNDLNAMHEAEKVLLSEYGMNYCTRLTYLIGKSVYASIHATARQRAEAFLRTLGKWEGTK